MNINDYINKLHDLKPDLVLLAARGINELPNSTLKNYIPEIRQSKSENLEEGLIFTLFSTYDIRFFRFGDFTFYDEIKIKDNKYIFAGSSYSELAFERFDTEVLEYDKEEWSLLNRCAKDTDAFLQALLAIFELYTLRIQGTVDPDDDEYNNIYIEKCTLSAGGAKYKNFFVQVI